MRYLALDLGTTFLKGAVVDLDAPRWGMCCASRFPPTCPVCRRCIPRWHVDAIVGATARLLARLGDAAPDAAGVVVCAQMHGMVLTDRQGRALVARDHLAGSAGR